MEIKYIAQFIPVITFIFSIYFGLKLWGHYTKTRSHVLVVVADWYYSIPIRFEFNSGEVFEANAAVVTLSADTDVFGKIFCDALDWFSVIDASRLDAATRTSGTMLLM